MGAGLVTEDRRPCAPWYACTTVAVMIFSVLIGCDTSFSGKRCEDVNGVNKPPPTWLQGTWMTLDNKYQLRVSESEIEYVTLIGRYESYNKYNARGLVSNCGDSYEIEIGDTKLIVSDRETTSVEKSRGYLKGITLIIQSGVTSGTRHTYNMVKDRKDRAAVPATLQVPSWLIGTWQNEQARVGLRGAITFQFATDRITESATPPRVLRRADVVLLQADEKGYAYRPRTHEHARVFARVSDNPSSVYVTIGRAGGFFYRAE